MDILSPGAGVITAIHVSFTPAVCSSFPSIPSCPFSLQVDEGDTVNVGVPFCQIDTDGAAAAAPAAAAAAPEAAAAPAAPAGELLTVSVPIMGESITEGSIGEWLKNVGDGVQKDEVVVIIETDKVSQDVMAPGSSQGQKWN